MLSSFPKTGRTDHACKALDRALIWNHYVVPHWYIPYERTARWDRFGKPDKLPTTPLVSQQSGGGTRKAKKVRRDEWLRLLGIALCAAQFLTTSSQAEPTHGLSVFGDLKYPPTSAIFDYVNPDAAKGGRMALIGQVANDTFDSFNAIILKGDAAQGLRMIFDTLMERAMDEPDAVYGLVAKTADLAADRKSLVFELRPEAKFADEQRSVTAEAVLQDSLPPALNPRS
jgi:ABC-type oligopeptide transport system substrate-binding subunit